MGSDVRLSLCTEFSSQVRELHHIRASNLNVILIGVWQILAFDTLQGVGWRLEEPRLVPPSDDQPRKLSGQLSVCLCMCKLFLSKNILYSL